MQHFGLVLNFLRDGECDLPSDPRERKELLREAEHYEVRPARVYSLSVAGFPLPRSRRLGCPGFLDACRQVAGLVTAEGVNFN